MSTVSAQLLPIQFFSPSDIYVKSSSTSRDDIIAVCNEGDIALSVSIKFVEESAGIISIIPIDTNEDPITDENTIPFGFSIVVDGGRGFTAHVICAKVQTFAVGGTWLGTDTTALIIGYSMLNAYWLAPIGIGIGVGVYLVKRKIE